MGWSCTSAVSNTLAKLKRECIRQTGRQNEFRFGRSTYFFELNGKEYPDGSAFVEIFKMVADKAIYWGSVRVAPNGDVHHDNDIIGRKVFDWLERIGNAKP
jgi:hypothetical protein